MDKEGLKRMINDAKTCGITSVESYVASFGTLLQLGYTQRESSRLIDTMNKQLELMTAYHNGFMDAMRMFNR